MAQRGPKGGGAWRYRPAKGLYEYRATFGPGDRRSFYARTKTAAMAKFHAAWGRRPAGDQGDEILLGAYLEGWLRDCRTRLRPGSAANHERQIKRLEPLYRWSLGDLSRELIREFLHDREAAGDTAHQRHALRKTLHAALEAAVEDRLLTVNPCARVPAPRLGRRTMTVWTEDQQRAFLVAAQRHRDFALYVVALHGGLRQGELFALRWQDIDWPGGRLVVQRALGRGTDSEPKTPHAIRAIDMAPAVMAILDRHRATRAGHGELVFTSPKGRALNQRNVRERSFLPLIARAGVPVIRMHDLRHTMATTWLARGINPKVVSERLGHASIEITLRVYAHVLPGVQRLAASSLADVIPETEAEKPIAQRRPPEAIRGIEGVPGDRADPEDLLGD